MNPTCIKRISLMPIYTYKALAISTLFFAVNMIACMLIIMSFAACRHVLL